MEKPTFQEKQKTVFKRKEELVKKATTSELLFKKRLEELNIRFFFQKGFIAGDFYCIADFYIPIPYKICIEIDGGYHDTLEQKKKDWARDNYMASRKVHTIRIKNEDVNTIDILSLLTTSQQRNLEKLKSSKKKKCF